VLRFELVAAVLYPIFAVSVLAGDARVFVTEPKLWLAVALKVAVTGIVAALASLYAQHSRRVRATFVA
jgi:hypothetical protein